MRIFYEFLVIPQNQRGRRTRYDYDALERGLHAFLVERGFALHRDESFVHTYSVDAGTPIQAKLIRKCVDRQIGTRVPHTFRAE